MAKTEHLHTLEDLIETWKKEDAKKNLRNFIGKTVFKGKSIFHYHPYHALTHPWLILECIGDEIKWAWQRVFRGWDDKVIWSIDFYLSKHIPSWMAQLKEKKHGVPNIMFQDGDYVGKNYEIPDDIFEKREEEYNIILDKIGEGFRQYNRMSDEVLSETEREIAEEKFKTAMDLFVKYFNTFWD